jgi:hypothetical protein
MEILMLLDVIMDDKELREYLKKVRAKIIDNHLHDFWVMCDRKDFKPIKDLTEAQLEEKIKEKAQYYIGKKIASIAIYVDPSKKAIKTDNILIRIPIVVMHVTEDAELEPIQFRSVTVNYYKEDLDERKFYLKDVERMMRMVVKKKLKSDALNGITMGEAIKKLAKKGIDLDDL